jgi:hypothetical protein
MIKLHTQSSIVQDNILNQAHLSAKQIKFNLK